MNYEAPLTTLVWLTSLVSWRSPPGFVAPDSQHRWRSTLWWKRSLVITCGTLAGAIIPNS